MALGISGLNQNIFLKPAETVSGAELSQVTQQILSAAANSSSVSSLEPSFKGLNLGKTYDVSLFGSTASNDTNAIKLAATNNAGYNLELSQKTLSSINALNAKAVVDVTNNIAQFRNGMIHINAEQPDFSGFKSAFIPVNSSQVFESMNLSKDRKGPSPFFIPRNVKNKVEKKESLDLIA